jgi:hypothetical protein
MIKKFSVFNNNGINVPISFKEYPDIFKNVDIKTMRSLWDGSKEGISWEYEGKQIFIKDSNVTVKGFPTLDFTKIVAVYTGLQGSYKPPNNAVIYNLDGSIHKILNIPKLISSHVLKLISQDKLDNPPLNLVDMEDGLLFGGFGWYKKNDGGRVNSISIIVSREWGETRVLNHITGEFGECLNSWPAMYSKQ